MAKLEATIHMGKLVDIVEDLRKLQTYKLDNSGELFVSLDDVIGVLKKNMTVTPEGKND